MSGTVPKEVFESVFHTMLERGVQQGLSKQAAAVAALKVAATGKLPAEAPSPSPDDTADMNKNLPPPPPSKQSTSIASDEKISSKIKSSLPPLPPPVLPYIDSTIIQSMIEIGKQEGTYRKLTSLIGEVFSSVKGLTNCFNPSSSTDKDDSSMEIDNNDDDNNDKEYLNNILDVKSLLSVYHAINLIPQPELGHKVMCRALESLASECRYYICRKVTTNENLKPFYIILLYPALNDPDLMTVLQGVLHAISELPSPILAHFKGYIESLSIENYQIILDMLRQFITCKVFEGSVDDVRPALRLQLYLYDIRIRHGMILDDFYNDAIKDYMDLDEGYGIRHEYQLWVEDIKQMEKYKVLLKRIEETNTKRSSSMMMKKDDDNGNDNTDGSGGGDSSGGDGSGKDDGSMIIDETNEDTSNDTDKSTLPIPPITTTTTTATANDKKSLAVASSSSSSSSSSSQILSTELLPPPKLPKLNSFISYPFVLHPSIKASVLKVSHDIKKSQERRARVREAVGRGQVSVVWCGVVYCSVVWCGVM